MYLHNPLVGFPNCSWGTGLELYSGLLRLSALAISYTDFLDTQVSISENGLDNANVIEERLTGASHSADSSSSAPR